MTQNNHVVEINKDTTDIAVSFSDTSNANKLFIVDATGMDATKLNAVIDGIKHGATVSISGDLHLVHGLADASSSGTYDSNFTTLLSKYKESTATANATGMEARELKTIANYINKLKTPVDEQDTAAINGKMVFSGESASLYVTTGEAVKLYNKFVEQDADNTITVDATHYNKTNNAVPSLIGITTNSAYDPLKGVDTIINWSDHVLTFKAGDIDGKTIKSATGSTSGKITIVGTGDDVFSLDSTNHAGANYTDLTDFGGTIQIRLGAGADKVILDVNDGQTQRIGQHYRDTPAPTALKDTNGEIKTSGSFANGDQLVFGKGVDIIQGFNAGNTNGDKLVVTSHYKAAYEKVIDASAGTINGLDAALGHAINAFTNNHLFYLKGTLDENTNTFTLDSIDGADTIIMMGDSTKPVYSQFMQSASSVVLVGVDAGDLVADNFAFDLNF